MKDLKINKKIVVNLQIEGIHYWKDCNIKEVEYLKNPHRHTFFIEVHKEVTHNDRDIEIIMFKNKIINYFGSQPVQFENKSCEDIAEYILYTFEACYVKVLEDNENGAILEL
jgi:hypothetical protein